MTGFKINVFLINDTINSFDTASYSSMLEGGLFASDSFKANLDVPTSLYGQPSTGRSCIMGLQDIDLFVY